MTRARRSAAPVLAIAVVAIAALLTRQPAYSAQEQTRLASGFAFRRMALPSVSAAPLQTERTVEPQLQHIRAWISAVGAGVSLGDIAGDGLPDDACLVDPRTNSVTVEPVPGTPRRFRPFVLTPRPLSYDPGTMAPMGCLPGQYAEDGRTDLLVYYWGRAPVLFLNRGGGRLSRRSFLPQELVPGGARLRWYTDVITQADVDGDGHPDLIVGNYFPDGARVLDAHATSDPAMQMQSSMSRAYNAGTDRILLWQGGHGGARPQASFREAVGALPARVAHGWTLAIGAADLTGDGLPAIYFANDFGPDHLMVNRSTPGHVRLVEVTGQRGLSTPGSDVLGHDSFKGMGIAFGDLTGSGRLDMMVSNITSQFALEESNFAWIRTAGPLAPGHPAPFVDRADALGLARSGWSWDVKIGDLNDGGRPQIVQAVGFVRGTVDRWPQLQELAMDGDTFLRYPWAWPNFKAGDDLSGHEHDAFWVRGPSGRYVDLAKRVGLEEPGVSRGVAMADVNGDGLLDFAIANQWAPSSIYWNHSPRAGSFLGLNLVVPAGAAASGASAATRVLQYPSQGLAARPAIGADATIQLPDGRRLVGEVDGGNGHASANAPELLFGLGSRAPDRLPVRLTWIAAGGALRHASLELAPGWHTVLLGAAR
jgi:enediyne biosynthesis protein E4